MNVQNMAKWMNDVERLNCEFTCGSGGYCGAYMDADRNGEYVRYTDYAALQQQLAAAREELAFADECVRVMELAIAKIAARRILATGTKSIPDLSAEEANKAAYDALCAIATLQRDRQP